MNNHARIALISINPCFGGNMNHYKSWSGLNKKLTDCLCGQLKDRITYFLTRYHEVHNSYGRAAVRLDGKELVNFSWVEMYQQDNDTNELYKESGKWDYDSPILKSKWDENATYSDGDFLSAATEFLQLSVSDALNSDDYLIRMFAIVDRRVGKRTIEKIKEKEEYKEYPQWVRQFYELRINSEKISP